MKNELLEIIKKNEKEFIEKGADLEHERWAKWQKYLHSFCIDASGSGIKHCIPQNLYNRWKKQIKTNYKDLSEQEKESDRKEVRKYMPFLKEIRIKELEVLIEILKKMKGDAIKYPFMSIEGKLDNYNKGYDKAFDNVIQILKDIIKKLKN